MRSFLDDFGAVFSGRLGTLGCSCGEGGGGIARCIQPFQNPIILSYKPYHIIISYTLSLACSIILVIWAGLRFAPEGICAENWLGVDLLFDFPAAIKYS